MSNSENSKARTYTIKMYGYGGEIVLGRVPARIYDYFRVNGIELSDFAVNCEDQQILDDDLQPFDPGAWFECDEIAHESGVEMDESCYIEIFDDLGEFIWSSNLEAATLEEVGCEVVSGKDIYASDQKEDSVVFYGQQFEKGTFFEGTITLDEPFDVTKLKFLCTDIEGWSICSGIEYNDTLIDETNYDVEEGNNYFAFIKVLPDGDTESYTGPDDNDFYQYSDEEACL
jgi:hypothetical protein